MSFFFMDFLGVFCIGLCSGDWVGCLFFGGRSVGCSICWLFVGFVINRNLFELYCQLDVKVPDGLC